MHTAHPQPVNNSRCTPAVDAVRAQVLESFCDCSGPACERMRWKVDAARTAQDFWLLRCDLFQLLAAQHCQAVAAVRINGLLPAFEGVVPARMLAAI
jgi:hypothetical protein